MSESETGCVPWAAVAMVTPAWCSCSMTRGPVSAQYLQTGVAGVDQRVPHLLERLRPEVLMAGQQPASDPPGRVDLAAAAALILTHDPLPDRADRLIREGDDMKSVGDEGRIRQPIAHARRERGGQVDYDVRGRLGHTPALVSDCVGQLGPQPHRQPRPRRRRRDLLGERPA